MNKNDHKRRVYALGELKRAVAAEDDSFGGEPVTEEFCSGYTAASVAGNK
jgi:hypothetical protein